jgi:hypothetical protein
MFGDLRDRPFRATERNIKAFYNQCNFHFGLRGNAAFASLFYQLLPVIFQTGYSGKVFGKVAPIVC